MPGIDTTLKIKQTSVCQESGVNDYGDILKKYGFTYRPVDYYYQVGTPNKVQGWILHISAVRTQIPSLLHAIAPLLKEHRTPFKVIQTKEKATAITDGSLGYNQLGKVVCIYPLDDTNSYLLAKELINITKNLRGCAIPTDCYLGGTLYTRYGSFSPIIYPDPIGHPERYIHDSNGQLIKDVYSIPFKPNNFTWPFKEIRNETTEKQVNFLQDRYKIISVLKLDAKGRVMKALCFRGFMLKWVVIKEAKQGICADDYGRDIQDRLNWQYKLLKDLEGKLLVPRVYDLFTDAGNSYLVMDFIKGKPLNEVIRDAYQASVWFKLDKSQKCFLINQLMKLLDTIQTLHNAGYIHRDITPVNFILDRHDKLVSIDLEMSWSMKQGVPTPLFSLGSPGYMSPEQMAIQKPEPSQDIYSIGAIMINFFTNLNPIKFRCGHSDLPVNLNFFVRNRKISNLIASCLKKYPTERPSLALIRSTIAEFLLEPEIERHNYEQDTISVKPFVRHLIQGIGSQAMVHESGVWLSNASKNDEPLANTQAGVARSTGFYFGVGGILYMLSEAACLGYEVERIRQRYLNNWQFLEKSFLQLLPNVIPGLYHGAAGVALTITKGMEAGLISQTYRSYIKECLKLSTLNPTLAHGISGQGLVALKCLEITDSREIEYMLTQYVDKLLALQQKDGSWLTIPPQGKSPIIYTGFSNGVAGICYFLLRYMDYSKDRKIYIAVTGGLNWLRKHMRSNKRGTYWYVSSDNKISNPWFSDGVTGIAHCFIKAYQITGDPIYRKIAEKTLLAHPMHLVHPNFSLAHGMTGLADTYLTAAEVLKDDKWQKRAHFIINTLVHTCRGSEQDSCYWIIEDNKMPTADLMIGNSGILYLLMRYDSQLSGFIL